MKYWLIVKVDIADEEKEIAAWRDEQDEIFSDVVISEENLEGEIDIFAMAIRDKTRIIHSKDGFVYPEYLSLETANVMRDMASA